VIPAPTIASTDPAAWGVAWTEAIELWMKQAGIGVDCSGLVYSILERLHAEHGAMLPRELGQSTYSIIDGQRATNADVPQFGSLGIDVPSPLELQPGDTMQIAGHVRIVMEVTTRQTAPTLVEFTTAESTPDGRSAAGTTYEGPRRHEWQWDGTTLRHRYPGGAWEDSGETPNYQRHVLPPADG
jgi:hypothetical protein